VKTFITALALVFALASGLSMLALAFRSDFREPAADNGGDWTPPVAAGGNPLSPTNMFGDITKPKTDVEFQQEKEREQAFKSGISKIPDAKGKVDP